MSLGYSAGNNIKAVASITMNVEYGVYPEVDSSSVLFWAITGKSGDSRKITKFENGRQL
jgi:hypothetical protein